MGLFRQGAATRKATSGQTTIFDGACLLDSIIIHDNGDDIALAVKDGNTTLGSTPLLAGDVPRVIKYGDYGLEISDSIKITLTGTDGATRLYKFDEVSGSTADDAGSDGSDGTLVNEASFQAGKIANAISLDGVDDHVTAGTGFFTTDGSEAFSVSAWVYPDIISRTLDIVMQRAASGDNIQIEILNTGILSLNMAWHNNRAMLVRSVDTVAATTWTHIVMTYDGEGVGAGVKWYINGSQVNTSIDLDNYDGTMVHSNVSAYIGSFKGAGSFYDGKIDDLRHYDFELTADEAEWLYNEDSGRDDDYSMADILVTYKH